VHAAGGLLDDEERVEPMQGDRVDMQQIAGQDRVRLRAEELGPARRGAGSIPALCRIFQTVEAPFR